MQMLINANLMEENKIQINGGITINVNVSVKNVVYVKNICGILLHVVVEIKNIQHIYESFIESISIFYLHFINYYSIIGSY